MGYFSNGSEGDDYAARYCARCVHRDGPDGNSGCAVWMAHMIHNYEHCNEPESILHMLIPRTRSKLDNEQCLMFHEGKPNPPMRLDETKILPSMVEWAKQRDLVQ